MNDIPTHKERMILRDLAKRVAEVASLPEQAKRIRLWKQFNSLKPERPMVLAYPEGGWRDLLPESVLQCFNPLFRSWEMTLRKTIYQFEKIHDDQPVTSNFNISWVMNYGDYGFLETRIRTDVLGSFTWKAPVKTIADLDKLHMRRISVDREETQKLKNMAKNILGDILNVRVYGPLWWSLGLTETLIKLRGLEQVMIDMYENPSLLHMLMSLLRDDILNMLDYCEREGLLSLNSGGDDFVGSAGIGATDELPQSDFIGGVRTCDMWVLGESQEFVGVGPDQFYEFALKYQLPILNKFGIVCYGCCEPLDKKFDLLIQHIPKLRRVSVSPWCNKKIAAEKLNDHFIYSWKPNPATICGPEVDYKFLEHDIRETLEIAKGCCVELIMKDTHTFHGDKERITKWTNMAQKIANEYAGG